MSNLKKKNKNCLRHVYLIIWDTAYANTCGKGPSCQCTYKLSICKLSK